MPPRHPRFVTACQQLLVLGVICAALTPAANIINLEMVPHGATGIESPASTATLEALVPTEPVEASVEEYPLTAPLGARLAPGSLEVSSRRKVAGSDVLTSRPQPVTGYGTVGVTWSADPREPVPAEDEIRVEVRTKDAAGWSDWSAAAYSDEHGPDPDSAEALDARPGTDELIVGDVDEVQVRIGTEGAAPSDLRLAVIDPGEAASSDREPAAIDTATLPGAAETDERSAATPEGAEGLELSAGSYTPKPTIFSRSQWGAKESLRDASSLRYSQVHAGFVHHTVNANGYSKRDVPSILRGIYAYHTQSRGWSDIGYNFLVDRFGRVWEGRYGGVGRPVVGAHTLGYNEDSFAMSAIGNFDVARPSKAMVKAYGAVFAWKLALHGVKAGSGKQRVASRTFAAISGHRDAASTACPGRYLYARIAQIRALARQAQVGFSGRQLESSVAAGKRPDIVVRRARDGRAMLIPIQRKHGGAYRSATAIPLAIDLSGVNRVLSAGDWNRDGKADLITRRKSDGQLSLRLGLGGTAFKAVQPLATGFGGVRLLAAVGDMTGDGFPDLMGQPSRGRPMMIYPGRGGAGLGTPYAASNRIAGSKQVGVGRWDQDGAPDTLVRTGKVLTMYRGNGPGGLIGSRQLPLNLAPYDWVVGVSDVGLQGHPDLIVRARGTGRLYLIEGHSSSFEAPRLLGRGWRGYDMVE